MTFSVTDIIADVRVAIDMNRADSSLIDDSDLDSLALDEIIRSKIEQAARVVIIKAPVVLLDSGRPLSGSISFREQVGVGRGRMQLPDDFLRLVTFKMSDWERAVTVPISEQDPRYALQSSRWPGIHGSPQRPVVAIVSEPVGLVLEFWSCEGGEEVVLQRGRYIPIPRIVDDAVDIPEKLRLPVVLHAAYLTLISLAEPDRASLLLAQSDALLQ